MLNTIFGIDIPKTRMEMTEAEEASVGMAD